MHVRRCSVAGLQCASVACRGQGRQPQRRRSGGDLSWRPPCNDEEKWPPAWVQRRWRCSARGGLELAHIAGPPPGPQGRTPLGRDPVFRRRRQAPLGGEEATREPGDIDLALAQKGGDGARRCSVASPGRRETDRQRSCRRGRRWWPPPPARPRARTRRHLLAARLAPAARTTAGPAPPNAHCRAHRGTTCRRGPNGRRRDRGVRRR